jgi:hypothetical protein
MASKIIGAKPEGPIAKPEPPKEEIVWEDDDSYDLAPTPSGSEQFNFCPYF